jgi:acyl-CoA reductase-like NAD-dependent aldehyde dehydrogenase
VPCKRSARTLIGFDAQRIRPSTSEQFAPGGYSRPKRGDPTDESTMPGQLASERALKGLLKQIEDAKAAAARIVHGGKRVQRPGFYLKPTIITDIARENPLYRQEAFGRCFRSI